MDSTENTTVIGNNVVINKILSGSFGWMALGLLISAVTSIVVALSPTLVNFIILSQFGFLAMIVIELAVVWYLSKKIMAMPAGRARFLFVLYAILSGVTLSVIFFAFQLTSIVSIFFSTAIMFAILSLYGARTTKDLSKIGRLAYFALIGMVIAMVINLFIGSGWLDLVLSWIGVIVFTVLTAYDVQKIKRLAETIQNPEDGKRVRILGALTLYLDFINLFLNLLRIFGRRK